MKRRACPRRAGLLLSQHGINGGYVLAHDPRKITALEVIRAIEGPLFITSCSSTEHDCDQSSRCTVPRCSNQPSA
ncbi:MAG: Rrf2 family transcriptional regulator [Candidatus Korobacteraceae bacterium]